MSEGNITSVSVLSAGSFRSLGSGVWSQWTRNACGVDGACTSASPSFSELLAGVYNKSSCAVAAWSEVSTYAFQLAEPVPQMDLGLSPEAQVVFDATVGALGDPAFSDKSKPAYDAFRRAFGTHFMTR